MRRKPMTFLLGRRLIVPVLGLLVLLTFLALVLPSRAEAGLQVQAQLRTPHVTVRVANAPRSYPIERVRIPSQVYMTKWNQKIARRLAKRTPYPKEVFVDLRKAGYSWSQIGHVLRIPQAVIRDAVRPYLVNSSRNQPCRQHLNHRGGGVCCWNGE